MDSQVTVTEVQDVLPAVAPRVFSAVRVLRRRAARRAEGAVSTLTSRNGWVAELEQYPNETVRKSSNRDPRRKDNVSS